MIILKKPLKGIKAEEFRQTVKSQMIWQGKTYRGLAKETGYSIKALHNAMTKDADISKFVASALSEVLGIDLRNFEKE